MTSNPLRGRPPRKPPGLDDLVHEIDGYLTSLDDADHARALWWLSRTIDRRRHHEQHRLLLAPSQLSPNEPTSAQP